MPFPFATDRYNIRLNDEFIAIWYCGFVSDDWFTHPFSGTAMTDHEVQQPAGTVPLPIANFPKQAIVVIHGMGEQMPMDTIKGFVRAVWETTTGLATTELPDPTAVWSKPDVRTGSLEL